MKVKWIYEKVISRIQKISLVDLLNILFLISGTILILAGTRRYGIGIGNDTITYLSVARNLVEGRGFTHINSDPYTSWPPMMPIMMAIPMIFKLRPEPFFLSLNLILFLSIIYLMGKTISLKTKGTLFLIFGLSFALFSKPNYIYSTMMMSEIPFTFLTFISLFLLYYHIKKNEARYLYLSIVFTSIACLTRYIGIVLVFSGSLILLVIGIGKIRERLIKSILYGSLSSIPTIIFLIHNYMSTGLIVGERYSSDHGLIWNLQKSYFIIMNWFIPNYFGLNIWIFLSLILLILFIFVTIIIINNIIKRKGEYELYTIFGIYSVTYIIFLIYSASTVGFDSLTDRFFVPVYFSIILLFVLSLNDIYENILLNIKNIKIQKSINILAISLIILMIVGSSLAVLEEVKIDYHKGARYFTREEWMESETIRFIQNNMTDNYYSSNYPDQIYYLTGLKNIGYIPVRNVQGSTQIVNGYQNFNETISSHDIIYIVWFTNVNRTWLFTIQEMQNIYQIEKIHTFNDGIIYILNKPT